MSINTNNLLIMDNRKTINSNDEHSNHPSLLITDQQHHQQDTKNMNNRKKDNIFNSSSNESSSSDSTTTILFENLVFRQWNPDRDLLKLCHKMKQERESSYILSQPVLSIPSVVAYRSFEWMSNNIFKKNPLEEKEAKRLALSRANNLLGWHIYVSPDGRYLSVLEMTRIEFFRVDKDQLVQLATLRPNEGETFLSIAWSPESHFVACTTTKDRVLIFDVLQSRVIHEAETLDVLTEETTIVGSFVIYPEHDNLNLIWVVCIDSTGLLNIFEYLCGRTFDSIFIKDSQLVIKAFVVPVAGKQDFSVHCYDNKLLFCYPEDNQDQIAFFESEIVLVNPFLKLLQCNRPCSHDLLSLEDPTDSYFAQLSQFIPKRSTTPIFSQVSPDHRLLAAVTHQGQALQLFQMNNLSLIKTFTLPDIFDTDHHAPKQTILKIYWWSNQHLVVESSLGEISIRPVSFVKMNLLSKYSSRKPENNLEQNLIQKQIVCVPSKFIFFLELKMKTIPCQYQDGVVIPYNAGNVPGELRNPNAVNGVVSKINGTFKYVTSLLIWHWDDSASLFDVVQRSYTLFMMNKTAPLEALQRRLKMKDYQSATILAQKYQLDVNIIHKTQWADNSIITSEFINELLPKITDIQWVLNTSLKSVCSNSKITQCLLRYGLTLTDSVGLKDIEMAMDSILAVLEGRAVHTEPRMVFGLSVDQICLYRLAFLQQLDVLDTFIAIKGDLNPSEFAKEFQDFKEKSLLHHAKLFAETANMTGLEILFKRHGHSLCTYRFSILMFIPELVPVSEYAHLLPKYHHSMDSEEFIRHIPWRKPDWCESADIKEFCGYNDKSPLKETPIYAGKEINLPTTPFPSSSVELTSWIEKRARIIEKNTGNVPLAIEFVKAAQSNGIQNLDNLLALLIAQHAIITRQAKRQLLVAIDFDLEKFEKMPPNVSLPLLLGSSADMLSPLTGEGIILSSVNMVEYLISIIIPYLLAIQPPISLQSTLGEMIYDMASEHFDSCCEILRQADPPSGRLCSIFSDQNALVDLMIKCAYRSKMMPLSTLNNIYEIIERVILYNSESKTIHEDVMLFLDVFRVHAKCFTLLSRYQNTQWTLNRFVETNESITLQRQLIGSLIETQQFSVTSDRSSPKSTTTDIQFLSLLSDVFEMKASGLLDLLTNREVYQAFAQFGLQEKQFHLVEYVLKCIENVQDKCVIYQDILSCAESIVYQMKSFATKSIKNDLSQLEKCTELLKFDSSEDLVGESQELHAILVSLKEATQRLHRLSQFIHALDDQTAVPFQPRDIYERRVSCLDVMECILDSQFDLYKQTQQLTKLFTRLKHIYSEQEFIQQDGDYIQTTDFKEDIFVHMEVLLMSGVFALQNN